MLFQGKLPPVLTVLLGNYILLLGFFLQVETALEFRYPLRPFNFSAFAAVTVFYWLFFVFFTFFRNDTNIRIIVISALLALYYLYGAMKLHKGSERSEYPSKRIWGIYYLFLLSSLFYVLRILFTLLGPGAVGSIFDRNLITTLSFLQIIIICIAFTMSLLNYALKEKTEAALEERNKLEYLFRFLNDTAQFLDINQLYSTIEKTLRLSLGVNNAAIFLLDKETQILNISYTFNDLNLPLDQVSSFKKGQGATGLSVESDQVIELEMATYQNRTVAEAYLEKGVVKLISSPIKSSDGMIGAITIALARREGGDIFDKAFFYHLGELIGLVLSNAQLFNKTIQLAHTDSLTGLLNRRKMTEVVYNEIRRMERSGKTFTLGIADLDDFKQVNDTYGHNCGDELLKSGARVFRETCRETDLICRWGGEEFLFLLIETNLDKSRKVAERIRRDFQAITVGCTENSRRTISIGLTEFEQGISLEQLVKRADEALYRAKEKGKNRVETG